MNQKEFKKKQIEICNEKGLTEDERQEKMKKLAFTFISESDKSGEKEGGIIGQKIID